MPENLSTTLADDAKAHTINLLRIEAGMRMEVVGMLDALEKDLLKQLASTDLTTAKKERLQSFLDQTTAQVSSAYKQIADVGEANLEKVAAISSKQVAKSIDAGVGVNIGTVLSPQQLTRIAKGPIVEGSPMADWWAGQDLAAQRRFKGAIQQGLLLGEDMASIQRRVRGSKASGFTDGALSVSKREAQALTRTAVQSVNNQARIDTLMENDDVVKGIEWVATLDARTTKTCMALDGKQWRLPDLKPIGHDKAFPGPVAHWGCFIGETAVESAGEVQASHRRRYSGDLVTVETASGRSITATPNHPILTRRGWIALEALEHSDELVCKKSHGSGTLGILPDDDHVVTFTEFQKAFAELPGMITVEMPVSAPDFHGDVGDNHVCEVTADSGLLSDIQAAAFPKVGSKFVFEGADLEMILAPGGSGAAKRFVAWAASATGPIGSSHARTFPPRPAGVKVFAAASCDPGGDAPTAQGGERNPEFGCDFAGCELVFGVELDRVSVIIRSEAVAVWVHNLETSAGWYFANGIASHNCRSTQGPVTYSWAELAGKKLKNKEGAPTFQEAFQKRLEQQGFSPEEAAKIEAKQRASMDGQVSDSKDWQAWLKGKGDDFALEKLGPGRFALWKQGKLTLTDLTDQQGRELTLAELEAAIDGGTIPPETEGRVFRPAVIARSYNAAEEAAARTGAMREALNLLAELKSLQSGSAKKRKAIIDALRALGITEWPDGRKLEDVIK